MTELVAKLVRTITLTKVSIWVLSIALGVLGVTVFENRAVLFDKAFEQKAAANRSASEIAPTFSISDQSQKHLAEVANADPDILSIIVSSADLRLNVRRIVYFYGKPESTALGAPVTTRMIDEFAVHRPILRLPLFTKVPEANRQVVKVLNGDFSCVPYSSTPLQSAAPLLNKGALISCASALPPYYGFFAGFVTVILRTDPTLEQQGRFKASLQVISNEVYLRDVVPFRNKQALIP